MASIVPYQSIPITERRDEMNHIMIGAPGGAQICSYEPAVLVPIERQHHSNTHKKSFAIIFKYRASLWLNHFGTIIGWSTPTHCLISCSLTRCRILAHCDRMHVRHKDARQGVQVVFDIFGTSMNRKYAQNVRLLREGEKFVDATIEVLSGASKRQLFTSDYDMTLDAPIIATLLRVLETYPNGLDTWQMNDILYDTPDRWLTICSPRKFKMVDFAAHYEEYFDISANLHPIIRARHRITSSIVVVTNDPGWCETLYADSTDVGAALAQFALTDASRSCHVCGWKSNNLKSKFCVHDGTALR